jgi:hypothetical protein
MVAAACFRSDRLTPRLMTTFPNSELGVATDGADGHIQQQPPATYYVDPEGVRWRVVDCVMVGGRLRRTALESPRATCRVFIDRQGLKRLHGRQPHEIWRIVPTVCLRQLRHASAAVVDFAEGEDVPR